MSLYFEAASFLSPVSVKDGSFKSRVFNTSLNLKSNPATIYALVSETAKYDSLLTEIIDNSGILTLEPKLTPILSLLLVHDHLFAKKGIAATTNHPLRLAVERHKARLQAELTKSRIRRGCASPKDLKQLVAQRAEKAGSGNGKPRWVRVNHLKTTLPEQMSAAFSGYTRIPRLADVISASPDQKLVYVDQHVPDLLALTPGTELTSTPAYKNGELILQDKASCFPALLLLAGLDRDEQGDILDACAAPGNKTTQLASILCQLPLSTSFAALSSSPKILACERDPRRSQTLQKMVKLASADNVVTVLARQDFLALDPADSRFKNVTHLLLDPSCSGSGIEGRDETPVLHLPKDPKLDNASSVDVDRKFHRKRLSKKRKQPSEFDRNGLLAGHEETLALESPNLESEPVLQVTDFARLEKLANLQAKIVEHAFSFPAARRITYSTCSTHVQENEAVVSRVLSTEVARQQGWRVMRQEEQPEGLRKWPHRGLDLSDTEVVDANLSLRAVVRQLSKEERQACIRCFAGDEEGTMGFFVCGFVREAGSISSNWSEERSEDEARGYGEDEEWKGFSDNADSPAEHS